MTKIGYKTYIGIAEEVTFGTAVQPTSYIEFYNESMVKEIEEILVDAVNGTPHVSRRHQGQESVSGTIEIPVIPGSAGFVTLVKGMCADTAAATTLSVGVYQYVYKLRPGDLNKSYTIQVCRDTGDTSSSINYTGCKMNTVGMANTVNDTLRASFEFMGKDAASADTVGTASYAATNIVTFRNGTIKFGATDVAATTTTFNDIAININNGAQDDRNIGVATRSLIEGGMAEVTWELNKVYEDQTIYDMYIAGSQAYLYAEWQGSSITAAYNETVKFESFKCYVNSPAIGNVSNANDLIKAPYNFRSIYQDGSVTALQVTVISPVGTY